MCVKLKVGVYKKNFKYIIYMYIHGYMLQHTLVKVACEHIAHKHIGPSLGVH